MKELTFIQFVTFIFMAYELAKILFPKYIWNQARASFFEKKNEKLAIPVLLGQNNFRPGTVPKRNLMLKYISTLYSIYTISMIWVKQYTFEIDGYLIRVGLGVFILSLIAAITLYKTLKSNSKFNFSIWIILTIDGILTIIMLSYVINPLTFFNLI